MGGSRVGRGVLVAGPDVGLAVGSSVALGSCGGLVSTGSWEVGVDICVRFTVGVAVFLGRSVGLLSSATPAPGVEVDGRAPVNGRVGVGVGVTSAMLPGLPVSGGTLIPSKSWMRRENPFRNSAAKQPTGSTATTFAFCVHGNKIRM